MFNSKIYVERRKALKKQVKSGVLLFPGNVECPMNYAANTYHFRQDSSFLYYFGLDKPGFTGLIDVEADKDYIFGDDFTIDDIIWMGPQPTIKDLASQVGVKFTGTPGELVEKIDKTVFEGRKVHYLPPYRAETMLQLEKLLGIASAKLKPYASEELIKAVVAQREIKTADEVAEIEKALDVSNEMYTIIMQLAMPGAYEREIAGKIEGLVGMHGGHISFPVILSIHGETLHNHFHGNQLVKNQLLVADSGVESPLCYASDITRTFPVGGSFTPQQLPVYQVALKAQMAAIEAIKPGISYKEIHLQTAKIIATGLKEIGLMKGDMDEAVAAGAHALFFPHGLGHQMGLDVHDMEALGENHVGYDQTVQRSSQFGLAYLRMAKTLRTGHVITVEPGIYFIPALIDLWKGEKKFMDFINYETVEKYRNFGGIRIEDDVLVTEKGFRVLGKPIPKEIEEIEALMN